MLGEVKYLGVIDSKLNWNQHLQKIISNVQTTFAVVRHIRGKKWGLRSSMVHWLYTRVIRPYFKVPWFGGPRLCKKTTKIQLGRIQRMACLTITGAMESSPTAAMEVLLDLTLLDLLIMAEARMAIYRLQILKQPAVPKMEAGLLSIWKNVGDCILDMRLDYTIPVYHHSKIFNVMIDWDYWRNKNIVFPDGALIWFMDGWL